MRIFGRSLPLIPIVLVLLPGSANAATIDGAALSWPWALPFIGILLTIATGPLLFRGIWSAHYGTFVFAWCMLTLVPIGLAYGGPAALALLTHAIVGDYVSFIVVLFTLYVVAGGIVVTGNLRGTPFTNTCILALGTLAASIVGTTGAAMIFIRPLLRTNHAREHNVHVVIFAIFLIANIGGALSPVGNPPLFVGFLHGVDFFWPVRMLLAPTVLVAGLTLAIFAVLDGWYYRKEPRLVAAHEGIHIRIHGALNFVLMIFVIGAIMLSAVWRPDISFDLFGTTLELQNLVRDVSLILIAIASLLLTPEEHRAANDFTWEPIREVAVLFAGIFLTLAPVVLMLQAGRAGAFAPLIDSVTRGDGGPNPVAYFWLSGLLSAFLDNAPTYLVFFELAGGDPALLMGPLALTLSAISLGACFMGALTYIGNAPNFMIYAIAEEHGVRMPSFFGYMIWSGLVLVPVFLVMAFTMWTGS